ncbi:N-acetylmuramoyl-L-alanine amidase [Clostridium sp. ZS2-4]|uniref:N-acetylmuramoyl-L-alanine amidase n=1 Tax=Clostridium sp. ZS2-4 TaxID=2987703 RepID=UPI00227A3A4C|nr:N-acetylmuramoyl-L-alanine amidase [Clostridium sp. ZS2-4]MCY6355393.1 N-acetylmuramoyl-L-alanine amidase [Clostridium sp. ZS2-4]
MKIIETNLNFGELQYGNKHTAIVLHHAEHSTCSIYDIHKWHIYDNGWSGIGYHFFITKDGQVYRGRPEDSIGAHCKGHNSYTLGVCVQGNYMNENMPNVQKKSLIELCSYLCNRYGIKIIKGHRELGQTNCPGTKFPLSEIRESIINNKKVVDSYTVKSGDTLWAISKKYNMSVDTLKKLNNLTTDVIYPNQILRIL